MLPAFGAQAANKIQLQFVEVLQLLLVGLLNLGKDCFAHSLTS